MSRKDLINAGLKLLGVYFAVSGLTSLWGGLVVVMTGPDHLARTGSVTASVILSPLLQLFLAFLLVVATRFSMALIGEAAPDDAKPGDGGATRERYKA